MLVPSSWMRHHPILSRVLVSILIGVVLEAVILGLQPPMLSMVRHEGDDLADRMIRLAEATTATLPRSPTFLLVDIDDATWASWGAPLVTPRDRIRDLLARVVRYGPELIILDVDLAFAGNSETAAGEAEPRDGDAGLQQFLAGYRPDWPLLLLARSLISPDPATGVRHSAPRPTRFDAVTAPLSNVAWTTPLFTEDEDGRVRRWQLAESVCVDGRPAVVPSMHLAAAVLVRDRLYGGDPAAESATSSQAGGTILAPLLARLAPLVPQNCASGAANKEAVTVSGWPADIPVVVDDPAIARGERADVSRSRRMEENVRGRVIYRVRWEPGSAALGPSVHRGEGGDVPLVAVRSAAAILRLPEDGGDVAAGAGASFAGRIVVISGSFADSGDWHATPVGRMPGGLMIINAIEALALGGTPREPSAGQGIAIGLAIIVCVALLNAVFRPAVAALFSAGCILAAMLLSLHSFKSGVVLDLAVPSVGIFLHDIYESLERGAEQLRHRGWRWFLRDRVDQPRRGGP